MYSVVLMMALSGSPEAVDFGGRNGCASACHGAVSHGCHGGNGCHRSGGHGLFRRHGCNGGCHNGCHATHVVSHGCHSSNGCHRSHGCHSSNGCHRSHGCNGGGLLRGLFHRNRCNGCHNGHNGCHVSHGCYASHGCAISAGHGCAGSGAVIIEERRDDRRDERKVMPKDKKQEEAQAVAPATIVVTLPADAALTFDGNATTSTSERRVFVTPALETGAEYSYNLQAQVGDAVQSRTVTVRGGQTTNVSFTFEAQGVASR